jgi:hypothetical protein
MLAGRDKKELLPPMYARVMEHAVSRVNSDIENIFSFYLSKYKDA